MGSRGTVGQGITKSKRITGVEANFPCHIKFADISPFPICTPCCALRAPDAALLPGASSRQARRRSSLSTLGGAQPGPRRRHFVECSRDCLWSREILEAGMRRWSSAGADWMGAGAEELRHRRQ